ncbi:MAG: hypothetical protein LBE38_07705 [Deltaproteobacteria bacterium]|jgi:hypothetical protein|nr:hypothetical protein [Deltaproteobacteria bacterium]
MTLFPPTAASSNENLARVQEGFVTNLEVSFDDFKPYLIIFLALIVICSIVAFISWRRRKARLKKMGWSSISNPQYIWEILTKAVFRQANVTLELYQVNQSIIYKGTLTALEGESFLIMSLAESPPVDMNFKDLPGVVHLNFRPSIKEPLEHYQFSSKVEDSRVTKIKNDWRDWQLVFPIPKVMTSAQRRSFLRMEPKSPFEIQCVLHEVPEDTFPDPSALKEVVRGQIVDISIGGAQLSISSEVSLKETQRFIGVMELPTENLDVELNYPILVLLIQLLSQEYLQNNTELGAKSSHLLRLRFLGQYFQDSLNKTWIYRSLAQIAMDDLSQWLLAYQRYIIKRNRNLLPMDNSLKPPNMFPSSPPKMNGPADNSENSGV